MVRYRDGGQNLNKYKRLSLYPKSKTFVAKRSSLVVYAISLLNCLQTRGG